MNFIEKKYHKNKYVMIHAFRTSKLKTKKQ